MHPNDQQGIPMSRPSREKIQQHAPVGSRSSLHSEASPSSGHGVIPGSISREVVRLRATTKNASQGHRPSRRLAVQREVLAPGFVTDRRLRLSRNGWVTMRQACEKDARQQHAFLVLMLRLAANARRELDESTPWLIIQGGILAEGAIALSVTLSGGALFAS